MKTLKDKWKNSTKNEKIPIILLIINILFFAVFSVAGLFNIVTYTISLILLGAFLLFENKFDILCPVMLFFIFYTYSIALGPIILYCNNVVFSFNYYLVIIGGLLAFCIGSVFVKYINKIFKNTEKFSTFKRVTEKKKHNINIRNLIEEKIKVKKVSFLRGLFIVSFLASLFFLINNFGLLTTNINSNRIDAIQGNGIILYVSQLPMFIIPFMLNIYLNGKGNINKIELIILTMLSTFTLLLSGFKAPVITMYILIVLILYKNNKIDIKKIIILGVTLVLITEALGVIRNNISGEGNNMPFLEKLTKNSTVSSININYIVNRFPDKVPFQNGYTYLINLKMLLPGPDPDFTLWLKEKLNLSFSGGGVTPTILGEFYINFGFWAIYVGMFLYGIIGERIKKYFKGKKEYFIEVFLIWQFAHAATGGIANVMIIVIFYLILYKFVSMLKE